MVLKIVIVGAGALGSLLGALLHEKGHEVLLVGRAAHVEAVAKEGLLVRGGAYGPERRVRVPAATEVRGFRPDLVVLGVKTQDVARALQEHHDALGDAPVVALQNGLAQDGLVAALCGPSRAVGAVAALDASFVEPGVVTCDRAGTLLVGPVSWQAEPAAEAAARALADAVEVARVPDLHGTRWTKLAVNLSNAIPAVTGLSYQEAAAHRGLARANVRMIREALAVARAEGATLRPIPWTSPALLHLTARVPEAIAARVYAARVRRLLGRAPAYGSTWQSAQRGSALETEWLNGEVVRRGAQAGVATPANAAAVRLALAGARMDADAAARALLTP